MAKKKLELSASHKLGIGVGLTAAAVAAAGAYFLYGSDEAAKNRKKVKGWMLRAKGEVLEALENADHMTEEQFQKLVDGVLATYNKAQTLSKKDLKDFKTEMAENWGGLITSGVAKVLTAEQIAKRVEKQEATAPKKAPAKKAAVKKVAAPKVVKAAPKKVAKAPAKKVTSK
jgi:hypothetical protein